VLAVYCVARIDGVHSDCWSAARAPRIIGRQYLYSRYHTSNILLDDKYNQNVVDVYDNAHSNGRRSKIVHQTNNNITRAAAARAAGRAAARRRCCCSQALLLHDGVDAEELHVLIPNITKLCCLN
jgi:hypothetical protein